MADPLVPEKAATLSASHQLKRLGKNINGYFGESIQIDAVLEDCISAGTRSGFAVEEFHSEPKRLLGFTRQAGPGSASERKRVYISAGIHGDEPAGPLAVRQLLQENQWPATLDLWLCPCLNPTGFRTNRRESAEGLDLNRQYLEPKAEETIAHIRWLERQPAFDLCLCLHEDWEAHGFYVYELNPDKLPSLAESMVERVAKLCPIDRSEMIEGRQAKDGIIRPTLDPVSRPQWPEAFYLLTHKTRLSYTLEAPSDFHLPARVTALVTAVMGTLESLVR